MIRRALPIALPRIGAACDEPWDAMARVEGGRYCARCEKVVHDFTRSTAREVLGMATLFGSGNLCGSMRVDAEGNGVFRKEKVAAVSGASGARAAIGSSLLAFASACSTVPLRSPSPPAPAVAPMASAVEARPAKNPVDAMPVDTDRDGITDDRDQCPNVPGDAENGCPKALTGVIVQSSGDMVVLEQPRFGAGNAKVSKESEPILEAVVDVLKAHPEIRLIEVHGHADHTERNAEKLSRDRADHVVDWLVAHGADRLRFVSVGDGSAKPIEPNQTAEGRAKNRRVEFRVVPEASQTSI